MALSVAAQQALANALNPFGSAIPTNGHVGEIINALGGSFGGNIAVGGPSNLLSSNFLFSFVGSGLTLGADVADGPGAIAIVLKSEENLTNATAKVVSIQNNFNVEVASVNADGSVEVAAIGAGFILKSPDGTRYKVSVANGGALSTVPA